MSFFKKERRIWHKLAYTCLKNVCASLVTNIDLRLAKCIGGGDVVLGAIILRLVKKKIWDMFNKDIICCGALAILIKYFKANPEAAETIYPFLYEAIGGWIGNDVGAEYGAKVGGAIHEGVNTKLLGTPEADTQMGQEMGRKAGGWIGLTVGIFIGGYIGWKMGEFVCKAFGGGT